MVAGLHRTIAASDNGLVNLHHPLSIGFPIQDSPEIPRKYLEHKGDKTGYYQV
jgi:hypothetical protein